MTGVDKKVSMAYAMGIADGKAELQPVVDGRCSRIGTCELADISPEWKWYVLEAWVYSDDNHNDEYTIYYRGEFGVGKRYVRVITVSSGFANYEHTLHLLLQAIDVHKSETK